MDANRQEYWHEGGSQEDEGAADAGARQDDKGPEKPEDEGQDEAASYEGKPAGAQEVPEEELNAPGDSSKR